MYNLVPHVFTFIDGDANIYRRSIRLLRRFEHKSPGQHRKNAQFELLKLDAAIIEHVKVCPAARTEFNLHPESGVFLIEGDPEEGNRLGAAKITDLSNGKSWESDDEQEIFCWIALLDGRDRELVRMNLSKRKFSEPWRQYQLWKNS